MCICVYVWRPELNVELIVSSVRPSIHAYVCLLTLGVGTNQRPSAARSSRLM